MMSRIERMDVGAVANRFVLANELVKLGTGGGVQEICQQLFTQFNTNSFIFNDPCAGNYSSIPNNATLSLRLGNKSTNNRSVALHAPLATLSLIKANCIIALRHVQ